MWMLPEGSPPLDMARWIIGLLAGLVSLALNHIGDYREFWWWDNLAHFTAGVSIGMMVRLLPRKRSPRDTSIISLGISTLWELAEREHGAWPYVSAAPPDKKAEDAILDTILVMAGAWIAARLDQDS
jgi:hypothetical protein